VRICVRRVVSEANPGVPRGVGVDARSAGGSGEVSGTGEVRAEGAHQAGSASQPLGSLLQLVVPGLPWSHHRGLHGHVEQPAKLVAVAFGTLVVAGAATGVAGEWGQARVRGQAIGVPVSRNSPTTAPSSAPRIGPMSGKDSMISARSSRRKVVRISWSLFLIRSTRASSWWARLRVRFAARASPERAVVWGWAA